MPNFLQTLGRNAGPIGAGIGAAVGGPAGRAMGGFIGGAIGGAFQVNVGNPSTSNADNDPAEGSILDSLIKRQQGRNLNSEALAMLRPLMVGAGDIAKQNAVRGAGRNAFGSLLREGQESASQKLGSMAKDTALLLQNQQFSALNDLLKSQLGSRQNMIQNKFGAQVEGNNRRDSFLNAVMGSAAQFVGQKKTQAITDDGNSYA
jgi:hypothetical protein